MPRVPIALKLIITSTQMVVKQRDKHKMSDIQLLRLSGKTNSNSQGKTCLLSKRNKRETIQSKVCNSKLHTKLFKLRIPPGQVTNLSRHNLRKRLP